MNHSQFSMLTQYRLAVFGSVACFAVCLCSNSNAADPLPSWNDGPTKKAILEFVAIERLGLGRCIGRDTRVRCRCTPHHVECGKDDCGTWLERGRSRRRGVREPVSIGRGQEGGATLYGAARSISTGHV